MVPPPSTMPAPVHFDDDASEPLSRGKKILKFLKTLLIAASVAVIVVGVAQTAMEFLFSDTPTAPAATPPKDQSKSPAVTEPRTQAPSTTPSRPMPAPEGTLPTPQATDPDATNSINNGASFFDPSTAIKLPDVTGSIPRKPAPPRTPAPAGQSNLDSLPTSISPALRTAAAANDPAAEYELGARYAEGRGMTQSMPEAVRWFERAAEAGFAPAQFRLASLNEKGEGMKKDVQAARRLYLAAASKGHAKAMHNLAVLYAEGIEGKPDYKAASEWFRKAASYGVTDSQYNLAILYARGIGIPANLSESYRWFALAAANGDTDAAKKRDEVAARLDQQAVAGAKLAVQTFVAEREPEEATDLKAPPGGWDRAPVKPRRQVPMSQVPVTQAPASTAR
jgi:localization factor PodJL